MSDDGERDWEDYRMRAYANWMAPFNGDPFTGGHGPLTRSGKHLPEFCVTCLRERRGPTPGEKP